MPFNFLSTRGLGELGLAVLQNLAKVCHFLHKCEYMSKVCLTVCVLKSISLMATTEVLNVAFVKFCLSHQELSLTQNLLQNPCAIHTQLML